MNALHFPATHLFKRRLGLIFTALLVFIVSLSLSAQAQTAPPSEPEKIIRTVVDDVFATINGDKGVMRSREKIYQLTKTKILPQFDAERITARAVGRQWLQLSDAQKTQLIDLFSNILIHTYSNALYTKDGEPQSYSINWGRADVDDKSALVRSTIKLANASYQFDYSLRFSNAKGWKLDDLLINNLSLFSAYRDQFKSIMDNGGGIDGLIKKLHEDRDRLAQ